MIESAAFAAVLINYDFWARGRLRNVPLEGLGRRMQRLGVRIPRGRGCASPGEAADAASSKTLNGGELGAGETVPSRTHSTVVFYL